VFFFSSKFGLLLVQETFQNMLAEWNQQFVIACTISQNCGETLREFQMVLCSSVSSSSPVILFLQHLQCKIEIQ